MGITGLVVVLAVLIGVLVLVAVLLGGVVRLGGQTTLQSFSSETNKVV